MAVVSGAQLAQVKLTSTTAVTVFTASLKTEITGIFAANLYGGTNYFYVYHDDNGTTYDDTSVILHNQSIAQYSNYNYQASSPGSGITVWRGGSIGAKITNATNYVTLTIYGITEQR